MVDLSHKKICHGLNFQPQVNHMLDVSVLFDSLCLKALCKKLFKANSLSLNYWKEILEEKRDILSQVIFLSFAFTHIGLFCQIMKRRKKSIPFTFLLAPFHPLPIWFVCLITLRYSLLDDNSCRKSWALGMIPMRPCVFEGFQIYSWIVCMC